MACTCVQTRYEFLESIVRLAKGKFVASGECKSVTAAVRKLLDEHVLPYVSRPDHHELCADASGRSSRLAKWDDSTRFREDVLWCQEVDLVYKRNLVELQDLYARYSGRYKLPGTVFVPDCWCTLHASHRVHVCRRDGMDVAG